MDWVCTRGACLLIPSGWGNKSHIFAVAIGPKVFDEYGAKDQVVLVSFTSVRPGLPHDGACPVHPGEHPFVTHESYVYYRSPRVEECATVNKMVGDKLWFAKEPCSAGLLARIVDGFSRSAMVPRHIRDLL